MLRPRRASRKDVATLLARPSEEVEAAPGRCPGPVCCALAPGMHDMRHIGTIVEQKQAERFVHFLDVQQIEATLRPLQEAFPVHRNKYRTCSIFSPFHRKSQ